jgi:hypothetical protein
MHITGPQSGNLSKAIQNAFPSPKGLREALKVRLDDDIWNYAGLDDEYPEIRSKLIAAYNARHKIGELVVALLDENPTNKNLVEFAWRHQIIKRPSGVTATGPEDGSLERMLDPVRGFTDVGTMLGRLGQIVNCVCHISYPTPQGTVNGSGFLIGDGTVLTNWHVAEKINQANRRDVKFQFDYRTGPDGKSLTPAVEFGLIDSEQEWLLDHSPYHEHDLNVVNLTKEQNLALDRPLDRLDYALLRVAGEPGKKPLGTKASENAEPRGYLKLSDAVDIPDMSQPAAIWIFQHPYEGGRSLPLQVDWNKPALLGINGNQTRILYDINTRPGSSGSPVFNTKLELIALHHAGGKDWPAAVQYLFNQGIPIQRLKGLLEQRGKLGEVR